MEYQEEYSSEHEEPAKRPEMLTALCVLSFINAAWNALSNFISFVFYDLFQNILGQMKDGKGMFEEMAKMYGDNWETMLEASSMAFSISRGYYFAELALYIASFIGVLKMWKLQKKGFHIYTISQILMLIATSIFVTAKVGGGFPFGAVIWTIFFVLMYYSYYKRVMK